MVLWLLSSYSVTRKKCIFWYLFLPEIKQANSWYYWSNLITFSQELTSVPGLDNFWTLFFIAAGFHPHNLATTPCGRYYFATLTKNSINVTAHLKFLELTSHSRNSFWLTHLITPKNQQFLFLLFPIRISYWLKLAHEKWQEKEKSLFCLHHPNLRYAHMQQPQDLNLQKYSL